MKYFTEVYCKKKVCTNYIAGFNLEKSILKWLTLIMILLLYLKQAAVICNMFLTT